MNNNNTVSDVTSEPKNISVELVDDENKNINLELEKNVEKIQLPESNDANFNFLSSNSRSSSTNTSYQDLPSLNFLDKSNKSELINSVEDSSPQVENEKKFQDDPLINFNSKFSEISSSRETLEPKFESIENFVYDVKKDIDKSKVYVDSYLKNELSPYEKYKFKEDFYSICKNSSSVRKPYDMISESFDSSRNFLKDSTKLLTSEYNWDVQRYTDFRYGITNDGLKYNEKIESTPIKRETAISAFETDPDILLLQKSSTSKECISPLTKKYLAQKNVKLNEPFSVINNNYTPKSETKFESDFLNIISLKIKKTDSIDDLKENNSIQNETIESEHLFSDYAKGPVFPSEVYGSRPGIDLCKEGIYTRKKKDVRINVPEYSKDESLDCEKLKQMDKRLKKMIKKNLKEDLKSHIVNMEISQNPDTICWEIPVEKKLSTSHLNETHSSPGQSFMSSNVPYLPLKDVPVHELVKKLRHEFELEGDLSCVPSGLNDIYHRFQNENTSTKTFKNRSDSTQSYDKRYKNKLENFVKNPAKVFIENIQNKGDVNLDRISEIESEKENIDEEKIKNRQLTKKYIDEQKQRHEKRIKKLEKLIKLEKLQVEKLKKILSLDLNDSTYTAIFDSYVKTNNDLNEEDEFLEKCENESHILDEGFKKSEQVVNDEVSKSQIENQTSGSESSIEEDLGDEDRNEGHEESGIESSESSSEKKVDKKTHEKSKISSWFCPIQPVKLAKEAPKPVLKEKKSEIFEVRLENNGVEIEPFNRKIGLQEAFQIYKYDFLKSSRNRIKEIKIKAARRQVARDLKIDNLIQMEQKLNKVKQNSKQKQNDIIDDGEKKITYFTIDKAMFSKNRHIMSSQEIVESTKKKYQKLPEVQQKKLKQKLEENKVRNRIKSNIFKKTIQQRVLSSGPNFNLNFKALENKL